MSDSDQAIPSNADNTPAVAPASAAADPIVTAIAINQADTHPDVAAGLRSYLEAQQRYLNLQMEHLLTVARP